MTTSIPPGNRKLWWLALAMTLLFAGWSLLGVAGDIAAFRAKAWVEAWSHQAGQAQARGAMFRPREADWQGARELAALSVRLSPFNADYREGLARIHEARFMMSGLGAEEARTDREKAVVLYREAIALRPSWPYTHAALAYALWRVAGPLPEVEAALADAARLGPWEPQVMEAVIDVGLDAWYVLSPSARQVVSDTILRSQSWRAGSLGQRHADRAWAIIRTHRKQALACAVLPQRDERIRSRCNPATWE